MNTMSFGQAVSSGFHNMLNFQGRARRKEYWYYIIAVVIIISVVAGIIEGITNIDPEKMTPYLSIVVFVLTIGCEVRRLHDTGKSGWWVLLGLTGIGGIVLFIFCVLDSTPGDNKYGPNPKGVTVVTYTEEKK